MFFHKFFSQKNEKEKAKAAKVDKRKDHDDSTSDSDSTPNDHDVEDSLREVSDAESNFFEEAEEDSDADEAEIWKVKHFLHF